MTKYETVSCQTVKNIYRTLTSLYFLLAFVSVLGISLFVIEIMVLIDYFCLVLSYLLANLNIIPKNISISAINQTIQVGFVYAHRSPVCISRSGHDATAYKCANAQVHTHHTTD